MTDIQTLVSTLIPTAREIATVRAEKGHIVGGLLGIPKACPAVVEEMLTKALTEAFKGETKTIQAISPARTFDVIEGIKTACEWLDKADQAEKARHTFTASDYRATATRKLAEAASWLF